MVFTWDVDNDLHATYLLADAAAYLHWDGLRIAQTARAWIVLRSPSARQEKLDTLSAIEGEKARLHVKTEVSCATL